jgi:hypothetical protein
MASPSASPTPPPASPSKTPTTIEGWRIILRIAGALIALGFFSFWAAAGANTGWTKDRIETRKTDEITGIEYSEFQEHFLPGIEFLGLGTGSGLAIIALTFFRKKTKTNS